MPLKQSHITLLAMVVAVATASLFCWTSSATAKTYHSEFYRYSVEVPEGWTTIDPSSLPEAAVDEMRRSMMNSPTDPQEQKMMEAMDLDIMLHAPSTQPNDIAYAAVVGYDLEQIGVPAEDADEFFRAAETAMTNTMPTSTVDFRDGFPQLDPGEVAIDTSSMQFVMRSRNRQGETILDGLTWAKTGKTRHIMLVLSTSTEHDASAARATIQETFQLHPDEVNHEAQASREYFETGRKFGVTIRYTIGTVVLIGLLVLLWRWRQKRKFARLADEVSR